MQVKYVKIEKHELKDCSIHSFCMNNKHHYALAVGRYEG